jgi:hypothetical protein
MTIRRLSVLQWIGALGAAVVVTATFLAGVGVTAAECNPGLDRWRIPHDGLLLGLTIAGVVLALAGEAAALAVYRATRGAGDEDAPPAGRLHFIATAALAANAIFLVVIVLTGVGALAVHMCRQA